MKTARSLVYLPLIFCILFSCSKKDNSTVLPVLPVVSPIAITNIYFENTPYNDTRFGTTINPQIRLRLSQPVKQSTAQTAFSITDGNGVAAALTISFQQADSSVLLTTVAPLPYLSNCTFRISTSLQSFAGASLATGVEKKFITKIDSSAKFPLITNNQLLDLVQQQTFKYFWDFGHPISGLARERSNGDNNLVTSGGSGFGIMTIPIGIQRNFISRADGLLRMEKIVSFLKNNAQTFHGAFPHWINGTTGSVIPFSAKDNGADLVETSFLLQGLLVARQYFNTANADEVALRADINSIWNNVEWDWFRKNNSNVLYWHWSPNYNWDMNLPIRGWNECLVTYILAASSTTHSIPATVYTNGWAGNTGFVNGASYFGYQLPLGPTQGGPMFFSHYSFLGINPTGLQDTYANYQTQTTSHAKINYNYCKANQNNRFGYSADCWGLTASDIPNGYDASSPTNDLGVIAPTAALASFPYTPAESMKALKFFYYIMGDKLWKEYGFIDAFSLKDLWFANSHLAIDQGPIVVMIENYRTGLIWNLLTSCPEVKTGMRSLGFTAPYL